MSPAGDACVKAVDSLLSRDNYSVVCEKDGMRLFEVSDLRTGNFVYGINCAIFLYFNKKLRVLN